MRRSELRLGRFDCISQIPLPGGLQLTFQYGKLEFELYLRNNGTMEFAAWKRGERFSPRPEVKLILWLKARQLGILEKYGFL